MILPKTAVRGRVKDIENELLKNIRKAIYVA
jgi:hypothetical protein